MKARKLIAAAAALLILLQMAAGCGKDPGASEGGSSMTDETSRTGGTETTDGITSDGTTGTAESGGSDARGTSAASSNGNSSGGGTAAAGNAAAAFSADRSAASFRMWRFSGSVCGFSTTGGDALRQGAQAATWSSAGGTLCTPGALSLPADAVRTVEVRIRAKKSTKLTVKWQGSDGQYTAARQAALSLSGDGKWHDLQLDLAAVKSWSGTVSQLSFALPAGQSAEIGYIRLTGVYLVPFPWLTGDFAKDAYRLRDIKNAFAAESGTVTVGFSALVQYLSATDGNDDLALSGMRSVAYLVKLAKAVDMPVMIWLRADPWAEPDSGVAKKLYADDANLMWTEKTEKSAAYRGSSTGYYYYCLAQKDQNGNKTAYWTYTEKLLAQCAAQVRAAIDADPGYILGVTTTSEYRYLSENTQHILDYNPRTILEFRDFCRGRYPTVGDLNKACGTAFGTWELRSTDNDPSTVENAGGFDAPRVRFTPEAFWTLWDEFREKQLCAAEQKLVDIIGAHLDSKYIYTHQIAYPDHTTASPITVGDAKGANVGIDFFNHEVTAENMNAIAGMMNGDLTRTWGVPEWLITKKAAASTVKTALDTMLKNDVKYLCPFNWGSKDEYDIQGSPGEQVLADWVAAQEKQANPLRSAKIRASKGFTGAEAAVDGKLTGNGAVFSALKAGDWIEFSLADTRCLSQIVLYPSKDGALPARVTLTATVDGKAKTLGTYRIDGDAPVALRFTQIKTGTVRLTADAPAADGKTAIAEIAAG